MFLNLFDRCIRDAVVWKHDPCAAGIGCDAAGSKKLAERLSDSAGQAMHRAVDSTYGAMEANVNLPLALGFGLQHPDQLAAIPADIRPDAAVFGSALLKHLDKGNTAKAFLEVWTR